MKKVPIIKIKPMRGIYDSDWDGVPNDRDCQWWNPNKQGKIHDKINEWIGKGQKKEKTMYEKNRDALRTSKYFDYRGTGYTHQEAMQSAREWVDERMPL